MRITSLQNPRVKAAAGLHHSRQRVRRQEFLIDGQREIERALDGEVEVREVYAYDPDASVPAMLRDRLQQRQARWFDVVGQVFQRLAYGERRTGLVAVASARPRTLDDLTCPSGQLVAVLDRIEKPGNLGAILRTAESAGVGAVIVSDGGTDLYNPNTIRASLGTVFTLSLACATGEQAKAWLAEQGYRVAAARLDGPIDYAHFDWRGSVAVVLGSEANGISACWQDADTKGVRLPMLGRCDSLNVSAAAAILFYEALRQRSQDS